MCSYSYFDGAKICEVRPQSYFRVSCGHIGDDVQRKQPVVVRLRSYIARFRFSQQPKSSFITFIIEIYRPRKFIQNSHHQCNPQLRSIHRFLRCVSSSYLYIAVLAASVAIDNRRRRHLIVMDSYRVLMSVLSHYYVFQVFGMAVSVAGIQYSIAR